MQPANVERAIAIGGVIAEVFSEGFNDIRGDRPEPHWVCIHAILKAVENRPELNNPGFVRGMLWWSCEYTAQGNYTYFADELENAVRWCSPSSLSVVAEALDCATFEYGGRSYQPPHLRQALALMVQLEGAGVSPGNTLALRNCFGLLRWWGYSWSEPGSAGKAAYDNPEAFGRALRGEPYQHGA